MGWLSMLYVVAVTALLLPTCYATCPERNIDLNITHEGALIFNRTVDNTICNTSFVLPEGSTNLYVTLNLADLEDDDTLTLYNVVDKKLKQVATVTKGQDDDSTLVVGFANQSYEVLLTLTLNSKTTGMYISIAEFSTEECVIGNIDDRTIIRSPDYEVGVGNPIHCITMMMPTMNAETVKPISLTFTIFEMNKDDTLVFEGGQLNVTLTGTDIPSDLILTNHQMAAVINITPQYGSHFSAALTHPTKECSATISGINSTQSFTSLRNPSTELYPANLDCRLLLRAAHDDMRFLVNYTSVSLAQDADNIIMKDGGASRFAQTVAVLRYGSEPGHPILSSGPEMWLKFTTDEAGAAHGASFDITPISTGGRFLVDQPTNVSLSSSNNHTSYFLFQVSELSNASRQVRLDIQAVKSSLTYATVINCYEGEDNSGQRLAYYRTDYLYYPALAHGSKMYCETVNGNPVLDVITATISPVTSGLIKFSDGLVDQYDLAMNLDGNAATWTILPVEADDQTAIQLVITKLEIPSGADVNITLRTLANAHIANLVPNASLPLAVRSTASRGLQLIVQSQSSETPAVLLIQASYQVNAYTYEVTETSGLITSPWYPQGIPLGAVYAWTFVIPSSKSLSFTSVGRFGLGPEDYLLFYVPDDTAPRGVNRTIDEFNGDTKEPGDVIIKNNASDELLVKVYLHADSKESSPLNPGFQFKHSMIDTGSSINVNSSTSNLSSSGYPAPLNKSLTSFYVLNWPKMDAKGKLNRVKIDLAFKPNNYTSLMLRDGDRSDSPILLPRVSAYMDGKNTYETTGSALYVSYEYTQQAIGNKTSTGAPFQMNFTTDACTKQCQSSKDNVTVCIIQSWVCDKVYQCMQGEDEVGCAPEPHSGGKTTGIAPWILGVSVAAAFLGGIIFLIIVLVIVARRRGQGYSQLRDMMAPVPT